VLQQSFFIGGLQPHTGNLAVDGNLCHFQSGRGGGGGGYLTLKAGIAQLQGRDECLALRFVLLQTISLFPGFPEKATTCFQTVLLQPDQFDCTIQFQHVVAILQSSFVSSSTCYVYNPLREDFCSIAAQGHMCVAVVVMGGGGGVPQVIS